MKVFRNIAISLLLVSSLFITPQAFAKADKLSTVIDLYQWGKTIHVVASFPEDGGKMTGKITGDCTGKIEGHYSGGNHGRKLEGEATARCPIFFFVIKPTAEFKGKVNNTNTSVDLHYMTHIEGHTISGIFPFPLSSN